MNYSYSIKLFIFIVILEIFIDAFNTQTYTCIINTQNTNPSTALLILFHHISNCFLLYGWLINNRIVAILHLVIVIFTMLHWKLNRNRCALTVKVNQQCGWNENKPFHDILDELGLKRIPAWNELWHYVFIIVGAGISIMRLF